MYKKIYLLPVKLFYYSLFLSLFSILINACNTTKEIPSKENYLPSILGTIKLGMTMGDVLQLRNKAYVVNSAQETPRHVYTEEFETEGYNSVYYFFSKNDSKKLVEINLYHTSKDAAAKTINDYFGEKQRKQNQWHKKLKDGTIVHATWRKQKVFIFVDVPEEENNKTEKNAEE
jgi:hypothetical protein